LAFSGYLVFTCRAPRRAAQVGNNLRYLNGNKRHYQIHIIMHSHSQFYRSVWDCL